MYIKLNKHLPILYLVPVVIGLAACTESADTSTSIVRTANSVELAIIGDAPYDTEELAEFPDLVDIINSDPFVNTAVHVGDIKAGDTVCSDQAYQDVFSLFQSFDDPLHYTMGDNEWADCDRISAGAFDSEERLFKLREIFFDDPETTLGGRAMPVEAQPNYPENQLWLEKGIVFSTLHVVGSNNKLRSGSGIAGPFEQTLTGVTEYGRRTAANLAWMRGAFSRAMETESAGIVLFLHADMWKQQEQFDLNIHDGFREIVQELSIQSESFSKPVLIVSGDNHRFRVDVGVPWFSLYDVSPVSNVTQITVQEGVEYYDDGSRVRLNWLRLIADASTEKVFSWELVSY